MYLGIYFMVKVGLPQVDKDYNLEDFDETHFDKLGDGCKKIFPIQLENKIKWSSEFFCCNKTKSIYWDYIS